MSSVPSWVYIARARSNTGAGKVGHSIEPLQRMKTFATGNPDPFVIRVLIPGDQNLETEIKEMFKDFRLENEFFEWVPEFESFVEVLECSNMTPEHLLNDRNGDAQSNGQSEFPLKAVGSIYEESNYSRFYNCSDNRKIDKTFLAKLTQKIKEKDLLKCQPILIVKRPGFYEIIDGHHRFLAAKALGVPVYFIITEAITRQDLLQLQNRKNWSIEDHLDFFIKEGQLSYIKVKELWEKNKWIGLSPSIIAVCAKPERALTNFRKGELHSLTEADIQRGQKIISWLRDYYLTLEKFHPIKKMRNKTKTLPLVKAMSRLANHPRYNHRKVLENLSETPLDFQSHEEPGEYVFMIESIQNGTKRKNRTILRARQ